jgi:phosphopantothenate-cysteine ligase
MAETLAKYNKARDSNMLLLVDFVTLSDYLFKLKSGTRIMATLGRSAMYYLAAAVSDFFIPVEKMVSFVSVGFVYLCEKQCIQV